MDLQHFESFEIKHFKYREFSAGQVIDQLKLHVIFCLLGRDEGILKRQVPRIRKKKEIKTWSSFMIGLDVVRIRLISSTDDWASCVVREMTISISYKQISKFTYFHG